ncbi:KAT8 regulatory NSL complex subunit 1-like protein [Discoglossus pictus]
MTPALTETATQGPGVHFSPSLSLLSLNSESSFMENSKSMEQSNLSKANGSSTVYTDTEQRLQTDFVSLKHVGSQSSAHYQTVFLLTSSAALNLQNKGGPAWKMEERDMCRQRFLTKKDAHPLLSGVSFHPERKVKRELFPGSVSQLLADVHKLWDITVTETQGGEENNIPKCKLNGRKVEAALAAPCSSDSPAPATGVPKNISTNSVLVRCLNQQQALLNRAKRNQKRLQILLAKHAAEHCTQQIRCFVNHRMQTVKKPARLQDGPPSKGIEDKESGAPGKATGLNNGICPTAAAVRKFSVSTGGILGHIEHELDSDATGSSSDEDPDERPKQPAAERNAELSWVSDRARVGSRWAWLQAQISDLEYKIQQLTDLHSQIRSTKGTVVFEEPSKGILGQESRLPEAGTLLSPAGRLQSPPEGANPSPAKDLEMSPSSPTLLLRNIEKQSAQLTEMVSSLIVPVSISPSQAAKTCGHKRMASGFPLSTGMLHEDRSLSLNGCCEQLQVKKRKKIRVKASSVLGTNISTSARTRALKTFHKRKLYRLTPECPPVHLALLSPEAVCSYEDFLHKTNHNSTRTSCHKLYRHRLMSRNAFQIDPFFHPVLSLPSDLPLRLYFGTLLKSNDIRGEALDRSLLKEEVDSMLSNAQECWDKSTTCKPQNRYEMRRRERRHVSETEADIRSPSTPKPSKDAAPADDMVVTPTSAQKSSAQRHVPRDSSAALSAARRRLKSESSYDIDNIVIPMSLVAPTKVEKLQYKEIITPSWKVVVLKTLKDHQDELEDLSDDAYFTRHEIYEQREKMRWSFWEQSKWPKRSRSSSNSFGSWSGSLQHSAEDCSSPSASSQGLLGSLSPDTDGSRTPQYADDMHQEKVEQWTRRVFPLTESAASALRSKPKTPKHSSKCHQPPTSTEEGERQPLHSTGDSSKR